MLVYFDKFRLKVIFKFFKQKIFYINKTENINFLNQKHLFSSKPSLAIKENEKIIKLLILGGRRMAICSYGC